MRTAFRILAYAIPVLVLVQAATIAWAVFGLSSWVEDGHALTKSTMDSNTFHFAEERGFMIHGITGQLLIPLVALVVFGLSFLVKVPGGTKWSAILLADVIVQVLLGSAAHAVPLLGMLHGINAFAVAGLGAAVGRMASQATPAEAVPATP